MVFGFARVLLGLLLSDVLLATARVRASTASAVASFGLASISIAAISGWCRSNAGDSERIRGIDTKLWRGGGQLVAHSRERPQPHGSSTPTSGELRVIHTL